MTIPLSNLGQVYLVCGKTDMRQSIDVAKNKHDFAVLDKTCKQV
ncbi:hypothetical protein FMV2238Y02_01770 [Streptococcus canis]|uniref:Uncharacterized protein n=1 Tax=Streptococcus canis TaxID=1329 RepID=A0A3P5Y1G7_STRCB|nr:hypothetical protein [Streptococcus canis]VDC41718.1 hypothetical protein FMV2238Y02_01770 [Streptococcus canis]